MPVNRGRLRDDASKLTFPDNNVPETVGCSDEKKFCFVLNDKAPLQSETITIRPNTKWHESRCSSCETSNGKHKERILKRER